MFEELTPPESWAELGKSDDAILVDCRSPSEWHFTGVPDFAEAWNKRATVRFLIGNDAGSRRDIARVMELEPRHFGALSGLGMINMRSGDLQAALQAFEAALRVNPHLDQAVDVTEQLRRRLRGQPL